MSVLFRVATNKFYFIYFVVGQAEKQTVIMDKINFFRAENLI